MSSQGELLDRLDPIITITESEQSEEFNYFVWTSVASTTWFLLAAYYVFTVAHKPKIVTGNLKLRNFLNDHVPILYEKYWPTWFVWEGRLQSILGLTQRLSESHKLPYKREIVKLQDGGEIAVDFLESAIDTGNENKLKVLLLPGLTSDSQTSYVKSLALAITKSGADLIVMNNRGLGGIPLKTPRTYCATKYDDVKEVIAHLEKKYPNEKMLAIGTSLGGMVLCQYLIGNAVEAQRHFHAALVISICFDPNSSTRNLEKPFLNKYIVNYGLTRNLVELAQMHREVLKRRNCWDFDKVLASRTLKEFDSCFTSVQFGYDSVQDYYDDANISNKLNQFSIPVFALNSADDPLQPGEFLPLKQAETEGSNIVMIVTERGGHLGFLEGHLPVKKPFHYMERVVCEFTEAVRLHVEDLNISLDRT